MEEKAVLFLFPGELAMESDNAMKCPLCGAEIKRGETDCPSCGNPLYWKTEARDDG